MSAPVLVGPALGASTSAIAAPLGLPPVPAPPHNPLTARKIALGQKLFFDRRLSFNGSLSCAMCHVPEQGFTSNELATSVGFEGASLRRNAPTLLNVAYHPLLFHDGRDDALETQVWGPLLAGDEMGNPSVGHVLAAIRALPDYAGRFQAAFGGHGPSADTVGQALASYERALVSGRSRFDRFRYGADAKALDRVEQQGLALFTGRAGCTSCHVIGERSALLSDFRFHNTGIGWLHEQRRGRESAVELVPGLKPTLDAQALADLSNPPVADLGRFEITQASGDHHAYKTPMLRNVARTAPYMHDGSLATLDAVATYYDRGGAGAPDQSPLIKPLGLSAQERLALVAFLRTLDGDTGAIARRPTAPR